MHEVDHLGLIVRPTRALAVREIGDKGDGPRCSFHRVKGHHKED